MMKMSNESMSNDENDSEDWENDLNEETDGKFFTVPQATPLYSTFSNSVVRKASRRTCLKKVRPLNVHKEDSSGTEHSIEKVINFKDSDHEKSKSISSDCFHDSLNSVGGITSIRNDHLERLFPIREDNREKLFTPLSWGSTKLVKRVPQTPLSSGIGKDEGQFPFLAKESTGTKDTNEINSENRHPIGEKVDRVSSDDVGLRSTGVLKDINTNINVKPQNYPEKCSRNEFDCKNAGGKAKKHFDGMYVCADRYNVNNRLRSQKALFNDHDVQIVSKLRVNNAILPKELIVNNERYTVLSKLGQGGSSQVFMVYDDKGNVLAIKCVNIMDVDDATATGYFKEVDILFDLQKSNRVIKLIDHEYDRQQQLLFVVMEKGDTDLSTLLKLMAKTGDVTLSMIIYYWTEMLLAVKEIHDHGIVHADLKPANFLLVHGRLKLIDFGISSAIQNDATSVQKSTMNGTCNYMSPEAIKDPGDSTRTKVGYKSDVWSLGCILYNLLYRKTPFQHIVNNLKKMQVIASCEYQIAFPHVDKCPPPLMNALKRCLTYEYKARPTVKELLNINYIWPSE